MSREDNVRLLARAYRCAEARAEEVLGQLETGQRQVISREALLRKAGVKHSDLRKTTRPLSHVGELGVSLKWPNRLGQHRGNGRGE